MLKDVSSIFSHAILYCLKIMHSFLTTKNVPWMGSEFITLHCTVCLKMITFRLIKNHFNFRAKMHENVKNCVCNPMSFLRGTSRTIWTEKNPIPKLQRFISRVACVKDTTNKSSNVKLGFTSCRQRSAAVSKRP